MGSAFKDAGGGVSSWILETIRERENGLSGRLDLLDCAYALYFTEAKRFCDRGKLGNLSEMPESAR